MKSTSVEDLEEKLSILAKGKRIVVLCVGNKMRGDDGAAQLLFRNLGNKTLRLRAIDCGTSPQDYLSQVIALEPGLVIFVNAIDRSLKPGALIFEELRLVESTGSSLIAHKFPLAWVASLIEMMADDGDSTIESVLVGIQIASTSGDITPPVRRSVAGLLTLFEKLDATATPFTSHAVD